MTDYYVEPGTGNDSNAGTSWGAGNSWATLQKAADTATAGDTCYLKATASPAETLSAAIDFDTNQGDTTSGLIKFIGVNSSGTNDGTRYVLDCNNSASIGVYNAGKYYLWFENIEVKNTNGGSGWDSTTYMLYCVFVNCCANNCDANGFDCASWRNCIFVRCIAYSNTAHGFDNPSWDCKFLFCRSRDNSDSGAYLYSAPDGQTYIGCIFDHNSDDGVENQRSNVLYFNCVFDDNGDDGIFVHGGAYNSWVFGCRFTNQTDTGLKSTSSLTVHGWNYFEDNTAANMSCTIAEEVLHDGTATDDEDQADTEEGYTDVDDPEDYNLRSDATLRRTAIEIPDS